MTDMTKTPRLYVETDLALGQPLRLEGASHHYLKNVMRISEGGILRAFNGRDGVLHPRDAKRQEIHRGGRGKTASCARAAETRPPSPLRALEKGADGFSD